MWQVTAGARTRAFVPAALAVVVCLIGSAAQAAYADRHRPRWDPRLRVIATKVERIRGLRFKHAVPVSFLSTRRFRRSLHKGGFKLDRAARRELRTNETLVRSLGLLGRKQSLFTLVNDTNTSDTLAYYRPETKRIYVRGTDVGVKTEVTLAHELTHALQDQHFDLGRLQHSTSGSDGEVALRGLFEGDALRVEGQYYAKLDPGVRAQFERAPRGRTEPSRARDGSWGVFAISGAPYGLGPAMVGLLEADGGEERIDRAFRHPSKNQIALLNPGTALTGFLAMPVPGPRLRHGERRVGEPFTLGAVTLYAALASRLDPALALLAADEWGGARAVAFMRGKDPCVRATFRAELPAGTAPLTQALRDWAARSPAGVARVQELAGDIMLYACAPPHQVTADADALANAVGIVVLRNLSVAGVLAQGEPRSVAKCAGDAIVTDTGFLSLARQFALATDPTPDQQAQLETRGEAAVQRCIDGYEPEYAPNL